VNGYTVDDPTTVIGSFWARTDVVNKTAHTSMISFFIFFLLVVLLFS